MTNSKSRANVEMTGEGNMCEILGGRRLGRDT